MQNNANSLEHDISYFKTLFSGVTKLGLPSLWKRNAKFYSKKEYQNLLRKKINEEPQEEELEGFISGNEAVDRLMPIFQVWIRLRSIFKYIGPLS